jgi:CDP-glucose 4,6-dehydratase
MVSSQPAFWHGKRVFITGHTGFKGSWLSLWLARRGAVLCGYALAPPSEPSLFAAANLAERMQSIAGDVRELESLQSAILEFQPDVVFHMAAQALVRPSYADPVATYATNVMGTVNLLYAASRLEKSCAVVNVTSDKCYRNDDPALGCREDDPMGGRDPYSSSKGCAELVSGAFQHSYFSAPGENGRRIALASARSGNVIGGGDWAQDRLVPDCFRALSQGRPARIRNPDSVRPWQHVLEPLNGYMMLAERLSADADTFSGGWNFGPGAEDAQPVAWIVERFLAAWPDAPPWEAVPTAELHEAAVLRLDCTLARSKLGWAPKLDIRAGLEWCSDWYRRYQGGEDAATLTLEQIGRYEASAGGEDAGE